MKYMLDTDTCSYALKGHERVTDRIDSHHRGDLVISVVTEAELRYGAERGPRYRAAVEGWLARVKALPFQSIDAVAYAGLRNTLVRQGTPIGDLDMLIAAHALALNLVLVTNNEREFRRVRGLKVENWTS